MTDFDNLKQRLLCASVAPASVAPKDALKYAAAKLDHDTAWALDSIGGDIDCGGEHETELDVIHDAIKMLRVMAAQYGDPNTYSDGRVVKSQAEITYGFYTDHVWHPDPSAEACRSWSGALHSDPGVPPPGVYTVTTHPKTQTIEVKVVRADNITDLDQYRGDRDS